MAMLRVIASVNCTVTADCANDRCFWRQRNQFGRNPWWINPNVWPKEAAEAEKRHEEITAKYGEPYFPEMKIGTGTNCMNVSCDGYKEQVPLKK